jgi:hypothetical protein
MKREWAKMMWYMFHSNDAATLGKPLSLHVMAINMYDSEKCGGMYCFPQGDAILTASQSDTPRHRKQFVGAHSCGT